MKFEKGHIKVGGRRPGSPNKKRVDVADRLECLGIDVIDELVKLMPEMDAASKSKVLVTLLAYVAPKPSSEPKNDSERSTEKYQAWTALESFYSSYLTQEELETAKEKFVHLTDYYAVPTIEDLLPIEVIARCHIAHEKRVEALEAKIAANEPL